MLDQGAESNDHIAGLAQALVERDATVAERDRQIANLEAQLATVYASRSWRITAPLRALRINLSGLRDWEKSVAAVRLAAAIGLKAALRTLRERRFLASSGAFDVGYYIREHPDVVVSGTDPVLHYLLYGVDLALDPNPLFDTDWYLRVNPDVAHSHANPLVHYLRVGASEGRDPSTRFATTAYLEANPDVAAAGHNPMVHYLRFGMKEERLLRKPAGPHRPIAFQHVDTKRRERVGKMLRMFRAGARAVYRHAPLPLPMKTRLKDRVLRLSAPKDGTAISYSDWIAANDTLSDHDRSLIRRHVAALRHAPKFSVLMPVFNSQTAYLRQAIESVSSQLYDNWELCVADDASTVPGIRSVLRAYAGMDARIKVAFREDNGGISACSNSALELATGDWLVLLDHDDVLAEHALYLIAESINRHADTAVVYSDEDHIDAKGRRSNPYFKPDWDHDRLLGQNMLNHVGAYRADIVRRVGGFREGFEGSQDWDLALRVLEATPGARVGHVPFILYHWRQSAGAFSRTAMSRAVDSARRAVYDHLERSSRPATVTPQGTSSYLQVTRPLPSESPLVSIVIPSKDQAPLLQTCMDGLLTRTTYAPIEIVIVDNGSTDPEALRLLADVGLRQNVKVIRDAADFNFSRLINEGVAASSGSVCVLLNNDIDVINPGWLGEMVSHALREDVGAVGAKLYYANDTIQHAGVVLGLGGVAGHPHRAKPRGYLGYFGDAVITRGTSCVTAACLAVRRDVFDSVGGFNASDLAVAFNDVDFCIRLLEAGYKVIWTPNAQLYHYESLSRGYETTPEKAERFRAEYRYMRRQWGHVLDNDVFYNDNLSLKDAFQLAPRSRAVKPWLHAAPDTSAGDATFAIRSLRDDRHRTKYRQVLLVGHSASGKSRLAKAAGIDRKVIDFDLYSKGSDSDALKLFSAFLSSPSRYLIAPNQPDVLAHLKRERTDEYADVAVVYLCRPKEVIREQLALINEDGGRHPAMAEARFADYYAAYDAMYREIADYIIEYPGRSVEELAFAIDALACELRGDDSGVLPVEAKLGLFHEYLLVKHHARHAPLKVASPDQMKQLTAGGYQVFDPMVFPPVPIAGSIAASKLRDLHWTRSEFNGMTVAEIGSQLGFFGFVAASLGAGHVIGMDVNPVFVEEANKFAVNYAHLGAWDGDKVMFRTQQLQLGDAIIGRPDVIVANSIVHWFMIQNEFAEIEDILAWLRENANIAVYFEGCVSASEDIMKQHGVSLDRYSEERFLAACERVFRKREVVGRCSYNPQRIVVRLYK